MATAGQIHESQIAASGPALAARAPRPPYLLRKLRMQPHLYSAVCRARMFHSRRIAGAAARRLFTQSPESFRSNPFESRQVQSLRRSGYALAPDFVAKATIDSIFAQADAMFRDLKIDLGRAYSVQNGQRRSLEHLSYDELAATEKMIALRDPLLHIPELVDVAFHETHPENRGEFSRIYSAALSRHRSPRFSAQSPAALQQFP